MTSPNPTGYGLRSRDLPGIHVQAPFTPNSLFVCSSADRLPASAGAWQLVLIPNRDFIAACFMRFQTCWYLTTLSSLSVWPVHRPSSLHTSGVPKNAKEKVTVLLFSYQYRASWMGASLSDLGCTLGFFSLFVRAVEDLLTLEWSTLLSLLYPICLDRFLAVLQSCLGFP